MTKFRALWEVLSESARLAVGQGSYRAYREHMATHHAEREVMDERTYFRRQQEARYKGRAGGRCC